MASFQAEIGWKRLRRRENKKYTSVTFLPDGLEEIKKKSKKILKNTIMAAFQAKIGWNRLRKRENKNYRSVSSLPDT